jgi:nitroimidazol reductase NimA-like FMN-containing flavoprotein (pyridoxamine 5'-phosphate oxidase superfamily)
MSRFEPDAETLLDRGLIGRLGFLAADGTPRVLPMWYVRDGHELLMTTGAPAYKARRLQTDPRAAFEVSTVERPYKILAASGTVAVEPVEGEAMVQLRRRIAARYIPEPAADHYARSAAWPVVCLRFRASRASYRDLGRS